MIKIMLIIASTIFVLAASFVFWVFLSIWNDGVFVLYEYDRAMNLVELTAALAIFSISLGCLGVSISYKRKK